MLNVLSNGWLCILYKPIPFQSSTFNHQDLIKVAIFNNNRPVQEAYVVSAHHWLVSHQSV